MAVTTEAVVSSLLASFAAGQRHETPYRHWLVSKCLPSGDCATRRPSSNECPSRC